MWLLAIIALMAILPAVLFRMFKFVVMALSLKLLPMAKVIIRVVINIFLARFFLGGSNQGISCELLERTLLIIKSPKGFS
jgi:hypothetical protein